ncbi:MAG: hypothetical protein COV67_13840 [Nitrospinae bacterium CG11_big_fil_rev_8_21_14_0_20_56_8]|nr:MAG: hypothetical protein COV67_13840 [Nitrospinae bacterium CG11_big_fil_rev_8_21_14_0_20_56_8]
MTPPPFSDHVLIDLVEPLNRYLHIPVAARIVKLWLPTRITPNQVTYLSVLFGLIAACIYTHGTAGALIHAGFFLEISLILDCVDGQLARARGQSSEWGRIIDGAAGYVAYLAVVAGIAKGFPGHGMALGFITFWTILKAISLDYCKQYMTSLVKTGQDGFLHEVLQTHIKLKLNPSRILKIYYYYLQAQQFFFRGHWTPLDRFDEAGIRYKMDHPLSEAERERFRCDIRNLSASWRWNGHEFCLFLIAVFSVLGILEICLTPLAVIMGIQYILTFAHHRVHARNETRP